MCGVWCVVCVRACGGGCVGCVGCVVVGAVTCGVLFSVCYEMCVVCCSECAARCVYIENVQVSTCNSKRPRVRNTRVSRRHPRGRVERAHGTRANTTPPLQPPTHETRGEQARTHQHNTNTNTDSPQSTQPNTPRSHKDLRNWRENRREKGKEGEE